MIDLERVKDYFKKDRFCLYNGIEIVSAAEDIAVCRFNIEERHLNAGGNVQGGMIYTLADFTFAVHANSSGKLTVSQNASINYLKPAKGAYLIGKSFKISGGKTTCLYKTEIYDDRDVLVAYATITGYILGENELA